jgi:hypothetical protein
MLSKRPRLATWSLDEGGSKGHCEDVEAPKISGPFCTKEFSGRPSISKSSMFIGSKGVEPVVLDGTEEHLIGCICTETGF